MTLLVLILATLALQAAAPWLEPPLGLDVYMPVPESNPLSAQAIEQGRRLFFDPRLSRDGTVSCATCHESERRFSDGQAVAVGVSGRHGRRNTPALINRGYGRLFFWDGRAGTLEEQVLRPIEDPNEMDLALPEASRRVGLTRDAIANALASYVRTIRSGNSRFDRYVNGNRTSLSAEEQHGLQVFRFSGRCTTCHIGPNFTDEKLHNTGIAWSGLRLTDTGGGRGHFKTPTLRDLVHTAPYMHDGSIATLDDVVEFYDRGGRPNPNLDAEIRPLALRLDEKRALVSFLKALAGVVRDVSF